ncbi:MAG: diguanylate cyclase, partial [Gammaproteobacteria bacterium]|nr:diguanylate cyclase [Gammaproteobacteria bacterium]
DYITKPFNNVELQARVQVGKRMLGLQQELNQAKEMLAFQASHDVLTGLLNRRAIMEALYKELSRSFRQQQPLCIAMCDIDFFKKINDNYGHMAGDKVLQTLAKLVQENIRETDLLTRYGGEEFVIIMPDTDQKAAMGVAEKLRVETENCAFHYRDTRVDITISCGITEFKDKNKDNPKTIFERADAALYKAKDAGRNRCIPG